MSEANRTLPQPSARATLGTSQLGTGLSVAGGFIMLNSAIRFATGVTDSSAPGLTLAAWLILFTTVVATVILIRANGNLLGDAGFALLVASLTVVVVLDLSAVWGREQSGQYPTAAVAVGGVLLGIVTLRAVRDVVICSAVLGIVIGVSLFGELHGDPLSISADLLVLGLAIIPPAIGCIIVGSYRRMVLMALDRVLIQSTVMAPAYGVSMLESEELAEIDLEVEQLFDDISTGREPLPLDEGRAERAGELAAELRRHLVAGRSYTWLYHAIAESDYLSDSVTLDDPESLAALLDQRQRDGLLSAIWLLILGDQKAVRQAEVRFGSTVAEPGHGRQILTFPIRIEAKGMRRVDVEPATWQHLSRAGRYVDSTTPGALVVVIECSVESPIDQGNRRSTRGENNEQR